MLGYLLIGFEFSVPGIPDKTAICLMHFGGKKTEMDTTVYLHKKCSYKPNISGKQKCERQQKKEIGGGKPVRKKLKVQRTETKSSQMTKDSSTQSKEEESSMRTDC